MPLLNHKPQADRYRLPGEPPEATASSSARCYRLAVLNDLPLEAFKPLPLSLRKGAADLLIWSNWNIIFSYTTYFDKAIQHDHFMQLAADVVQSGLAVISYYSEGFLIWKSQEIHAEAFGIQQEPFVRLSSADVEFPDGLNPYQMQCALQAAQLHFYEQHVVSPMVAEGMCYFRAFLDPCELQIGGNNILLYPTVIVHRNGVFQMQFRLLSKGSLMSTRELIDEFLNFPMASAKDILLPPSLMRLDARKLLFEDEYYGKRSTHQREWNRLNIIIEQASFRYEGDPDSFDHDLISIDPEGKNRGPQSSLESLTSMLGNAVETLLNQPRMGWKYSLLGQKKPRYSLGNFWSGRPSVYLLTMRDHPRLASEIHSKYASELGHIMARSRDISITQAQKQLGDSLRMADDYLSYTGTALNLFAYSRSGIEQRNDTDPNGNGLVYALQAQVDLVDYINGSLWQCEERALLHARTVEELIANRERQTMYDYAGRYPFHFGELNDWFNAVQKTMNMDATRAAIAFNTTLNLEKFKEKRNFKRQQFQWLMAALLGIIAAGTSGGKLTGLIWEGVGGKALTEFHYALMAMAVVGSVFLIAYKIFVEPI